MTVPDLSKERRLARLERSVDELTRRQTQSERLPTAVEPLRGRLWLFTLSEDMGATTTDEASADLLTLDKTDTAKNVTVVDPTSQNTGLASGSSGECIEQLNTDGTRYFVVLTGSGQSKSHCRFTLDSALATSDESKSATISDQWGYGSDHGTSITVYNLETHTANTYVFEGDSGDAGIATYDPDEDQWWIIQMECP